MSDKSAKLEELFQCLDEDVKSKLRSIGTIRHPCAKGEIAENIWIELLQSYLPERYKVDSGFVVDSKNKISDQIDIIIYDRHYTPSIFKSGNIKCIPAEGVYAVFEVKPDFNKENYEYTLEKIKSVQTLQITTSTFNDFKGPQKKSIENHKILGGIITKKRVAENNLKKLWIWILFCLSITL